MSKKLIVFGFWTNSNNELATNGLITQSTTSFLLLAKNLNKSKHNKHRKISFVLIEHFSLHFANIFFLPKKRLISKRRIIQKNKKKSIIQEFPIIFIHKKIMSMLHIPTSIYL